MEQSLDKRGVAMGTRKVFSMTRVVNLILNSLITWRIESHGEKGVERDRKRSYVRG